MDILWDVANSKIDRICHFVTEKGELRFVGRKDQRDDCSSWPMRLKNCLMLYISTQIPIEN